MKARIVHFVVAQLTQEKPNGSKKEVVIDIKKKSPDYEEYFPTYSVLKTGTADGLNFAVKKFEKNIVVEISKDVDSASAEKLIEEKDAIFDARQKFLKGFDVHLFIEDFTVYCFSGYDALDELVKKRKYFIFKLLKSQKEPVPDKIADFEKYGLQYSSDDMMFADWDNAVVFDKDGDFEDDISILELANIRLLNLRILERSLNDVVDPRNMKRVNFFSMRRIMKEIYERRMEMVSNYEAIENSLPLFGDWYTAKLYNRMCEILHVKDWSERINDKLDNLEDVYELLNNRATNGYMLILEASIVALIIFEILVTFVLG